MKIKRFNIHTQPGNSIHTVPGTVVPSNTGDWVKFVNVIPLLHLDEVTEPDHPEHMRMINESEFCLGRYMTQERAQVAADTCTDMTGEPHHTFLSHYRCPYDHYDKMFWSVLRTQEKTV